MSSSCFRISTGLSRVELLFLLAILTILVVIGYGPVSGYLDSINVDHAAEKARTLSTILAQYATDNNGVYPAGEGTSSAGKPLGIAHNLLEGQYTPDASVFAVGSTPRYRGKTTDYSDLDAANISWDFTGGTTATTGLTSSAPDLLPVVYTTGENVAYPVTAGTGLNLLVSGKGPFGNRGIVVAYKNGNGAFIPATPSGTSLECRDFISRGFKDTSVYTQIRP